MKALIIRVLRQLKNDPRTLALMFFAPLLMMGLIYLLLGDTEYNPKVGIVNMPEEFSEILAENADVCNYEIYNSEEIDEVGYQLFADSCLKAETVDAVLYNIDETLFIRTLEQNSKSGSAIQAIQTAMSEMMPMGQIEISSVYGSSDENTFDSLAYVFLAILAFFFTFIISGMSLVRERFSFTLERMLMTPIRRWQIVGGYACAYALLAIIQVSIIFLFSIYLLDIHVEGNIFLCVVILMLEGICAVEFGSLISSFANSEFQVMQFIPIIIIPQIFFTGIIPLDTIPYHLGNLCYVMPMYYGAAPLKEIMQRGAGFVDVYLWILALCVFIIVLFVLNTLSLKKYRKL
ncbi:MAG: ABC transporter permease [Candidatus Aphodosoma sp.]